MGRPRARNVFIPSQDSGDESSSEQSVEAQEFLHSKYISRSSQRFRERLSKVARGSESPDYEEAIEDDAEEDIQPFPDEVQPPQPEVAFDDNLELPDDLNDDQDMEHEPEIEIGPESVTGVRSFISSK